ncbi:MAG: hypothetical protein QM722_08610 [Piscinibacter sp.]
MSRPWKSELRIRLGRRGCELQLCAAWSRRVIAQAGAAGTPAEALPVALAALREQAGPALSGEARLRVPDELVYLSLRPAATTWPAARQEAIAHFGAALGRQDLVVQVVALPGGSGWLAAAIEPGDLRAWQGALADAGIRLAHVELALLDDLRQLAAQVADEAVVALLRDEGLTLLRIASGVPVGLVWERCDPRTLRLAEQRVSAFQSAMAGDTATPVWLRCRTRAECAQWQSLAHEHGWTLLPPGDAAAAATAAPEARA